MNKTNHPHEVIVSGIHLELTPALKSYTRDKLERLFRHEDRIVRIKVELECDRKHDKEHMFIAKAHIVIHGPDINGLVESDDCYKAVDLLIDKLDQVIRRRHGVQKTKRNHPHAVEFYGVALPKAI